MHVLQEARKTSMARQERVSLCVLIILTLAAMAVGLTVAPRKLEICNCEEEGWSLKIIMRYQLVSDFLISLSYFSIPLELLYFISCTDVFPFWWVVGQFGAFIVLCGLTHFVSIWTYGPHSFNIKLIQTILKIITALVSCATAISLVHIIPMLLQVKMRELFLQTKAEELNREMDLIRRQEEAGRHVHMLTQEIRNSIDRHTILATTLAELGKTLNLENCMIWTPNSDGTALELTHELKRRHMQDPVIISSDDPIVKSVKESREAVGIPSNCSLRTATEDIVEGGAMAAIRLPLLHVSNFKGGTPERLKTSYAIMVLVGDEDKQWAANELEIMEVVADQVAVALSHAAVLEESRRMRDQLVEQNKALQLARWDAETAMRARSHFLLVMNHEMRTPLHAIMALSSLLHETNMNSDQRSMVETLNKSSRLLSTLISDVLDYSRLEDGNLALDLRSFELPTVLREVANVAIPMAGSKKLNFCFDIAEDMPRFVIGDEKRLLQVTLNLIGNAVRYTTQGMISVCVSVLDKTEFNRDHRNAGWRPSFCENCVYLRIEVKGSGLGVAKSDISKLFQKPGQAESSTASQRGGNLGLGLAICKKLVALMHGNIWIESDGLGTSSTITFMLRLQLTSTLAGMEPEEPLSKEELKGLKVLVTDDNIVNRIVTQRLLEKLGCEATVVDSGRQCLSTLTQPGGKGFRLLLLDLCMPGMDGYEVALRIQRNFHPEIRPLVIALTASTDDSTQERCLKVGMDGILFKPLSLGEMSKKLSQILKKKPAVRYMTIR